MEGTPATRGGDGGDEDEEGRGWTGWMHSLGRDAVSSRVSITRASCGWAGRPGRVSRWVVRIARSSASLSMFDAYRGRWSMVHAMGLVNGLQSAMPVAVISPHLHFGW